MAAPKKKIAKIFFVILGLDLSPPQRLFKIDTLHCTLHGGSAALLGPLFKGAQAKGGKARERREASARFTSQSGTKCHSKRNR